MDETTAHSPSTPDAAPISNLEHVSPLAATERVSAAFASIQAEIEALHASTAQQENRAAELEAREAHLREHAAKLAKREAQLGDLNAAQEQFKAREQVIAQREAELQAQHSSASQQQQRAAELDVCEAHLRDHAAKLSEREFQLAERERELSAAREQISTREQSLAQRETEIAAAAAVQPSPPQPNNPSIVLRRGRLKKQRTLLAERAVQLIRAKEAIAGRLSDTARTRNSLPLAGGAAPAPAPMAPAPAPRRSGLASFGTGMLTSAVALAVIAGVSWWAAGLIDQPRFAAQTTIGMENQGDSVDPGAAESWATFHQELANDPQLLERAATRLGQRGYDDLRTPSDLREFLDESLVIDSGVPGRLKLSATGQGRLRTQRILEAFTAVLIGMSNDSRDRRADRANTVVLSDSKSADEPVEDHRLPIFAGISGGMTILCGLIGLTVVGMTTGARPAKNNSAVANDGGEDVWNVR